MRRAQASASFVMLATLRRDVSDESDRLEVYVQSFPELRRKKRVSADGGTEPLWKRDGTELFYRMDNKMMAVPTTFTPELVLGVPKILVSVYR